MSTVDALIVVAFIAYAITAGFRHRRQASKNLEEYFLATVKQDKADRGAAAAAESTARSAGASVDTSGAQEDALHSRPPRAAAGGAR